MEQRETIKEGSWLSLPESEPREENISSIIDLISGKTHLRMLISLFPHLLFSQ